MLVPELGAQRVDVVRREGEVAWPWPVRSFRGGPLGCTAVMDPPYETGRPARKWPRRPRLSWPMLRDGGANSSEAQLCVISTSGAPGDVKVILISPCVFCMENHL